MRPLSMPAITGFLTIIFSVVTAGFNLHQVGAFPTGGPECLFHQQTRENHEVADKGPKDGKQDLVFTRVFDAPVERVWQAWTDPELVMRWWGPNGFTCPLARLDVREGGKSLVCMRAPQEFGGQDMYSTWTYTRIEPLREIEYLHHFADEDGNRVEPAAQGLPPDMPSEVRNRVTFKPVGENRTEVAVTEYDWPEGKMREMSRQGMEQCLDKMAGVLAEP